MPVVNYSNSGRFTRQALWHMLPCHHVFHTGSVVRTVHAQHWLSQMRDETSSPRLGLCQVLNSEKKLKLRERRR